MVALYPSISKEVAKEICREAAFESEIEVASMNYLEATRFLALTEEQEAWSNSEEFLEPTNQQPGTVGVARCNPV